jgi:MFS family permease
VLVALAASGAADGALPVVLSFAVLRSPGSAGRLGFVLAAQSTSALLLTLAGGLAGDRFARGPIMIASLLARMTAAVVLTTLLLAGTASSVLLAALACLYGGADGFFGPASAALLPDIVPRPQLISANALAGGTQSAAVIAAPVAAGVIVAALGPGWGFACQGGLLAIAAGSLAAARLPGGRGSPAARVGLLSQLRDGWAEFAGRPWLWLLTGEWTVFSLVILAPVTVLGPTIADRDLGGPLAWGIISSCLAVGAVAGQLAAGRIRPARPGSWIAGLVPVMTGEALALGLGAPLAVVAPAAAVTGLAMGLQATAFRTAMQASVPGAALARVTAIDLLGSEGGQPVGYALAGPAAAAAGAHSLLTASAAGMFAASVAFAWLVRGLLAGQSTGGRQAE